MPGGPGIVNKPYMADKGMWKEGKEVNPIFYGAPRYKKAPSGLEDPPGQISQEAYRDDKLIIPQRNSVCKGRVS